MKRKILCIMCCIMLCGVATACSGNEVEENNVKEEVSEEENEIPESVKQEIEKETEKESVYICYSEDAMTFITEEIKVNEVNPEAIIRELVNRNVMIEAVKVMSFAIEEVDGEKIIYLDLNQAFSQYISSMGSAGEYYILGGLCNSFLQTYECEKIMVTVNGNALLTGHSDSSEYYNMFE